MDLAIDTTHVYWTGFTSESEIGAGGIVKAPIGGGTIVELTQATYPELLAVDDTNVYYTGWSDALSIWKIPIGGGDPTLLATRPDRFIFDLAATNGYVYWSERKHCKNPTECAVPGLGRVARIPTSGGEPIELAVAESPLSLAVTADLVYWTEDDGIWSVSLNGSDPPRKVTPLMPIEGVSPTRTRLVDAFLVRGAELYWVTGGVGQDTVTLFHAPSEGGESTPLRSEPSVFGTSHLVVDATDAYWPSYSDDAGSLIRIPLDGGPISTLHSESLDPGTSIGFDIVGLALDDDNIYWANSWRGVHQMRKSARR